MAWRGFPDVLSKGLETNFVIFSEMTKKGEIPEPRETTYKDMISKVILFNECDKIIADHKFGGFKAQQNYYTVALRGSSNNRKSNVHRVEPFYEPYDTRS